MQRFMLFYVFIALSALLIFACSVDNPTTPEISQAPEISQDSEISQSYKVTTQGAKKPAANLIGEMDLYFDLSAIWPEEPVWVGTITFKGYGTFDMRFFHLSEFKGYSQASPFKERFEIYAEGGDPDDYTDDVIYLAGPDVGVTTLANKPPEDTKYRMNGKIDVATEPFEEWFGRHVHMSGTITWQFVTLPDETVILAPETAPGTFRLN